MLEVKARILSRSVYIPEETITCELVVTHKTQTNNDDDERSMTFWNKVNQGSPSADSVTVAYASAQVYCQCHLNERRLQLPKPLLIRTNNHSSQTTSFSPVIGERGNPLYMSEPKILFCDLRLKKGESKKYIYKETLPCDIPPSYKGQNIKMSYKVCIGVGRIGKPVHTMLLPFRVFELRGIFKALKQKAEQEKSLDNKHRNIPNHDPTTINPFLQEKEAKKISKLDVAMDALTAFTVKRNLNTYNIHSQSGGVGKFCMSKHYYRIGEDILGTFDFNCSPIACVKYVVSVQVEETISKTCALQPSTQNLIHYTTISRHEECCYLASKTNFLLPIPVTATPEFTHKIVSVRWRLHFEFTIERKSERESSEDVPVDVEKKGVEEGGDGAKIDGIPTHLRTELMLWDLPIRVVATNPIQASLMMQAESEEKVVLQS